MTDRVDPTGIFRPFWLNLRSGSTGTGPGTGQGWQGAGPAGFGWENRGRDRSVQIDLIFDTKHGFLITTIRK